MEMIRLCVSLTTVWVCCRELQQQMCAFAAGLKDLGLRKGQRVSLFAENSSRWLVADQGIMFNGAANAVRRTGCDSVDSLRLV